MTLGTTLLIHEADGDEPYNAVAGGICGENDGIIGDPNGNSWVHTSVNVTGAADLGGLCAKNDNAIHYAYATGNVTGTIADYVAHNDDITKKNFHYGGFVGHNNENHLDSGAVIDHCYSEGTVRLNVNTDLEFEDINDEFRFNVGGFVGRSEIEQYGRTTSIDRCYTISDVEVESPDGGITFTVPGGCSVDFNVGGFAGFIHEHAGGTATSEVTNSYSKVGHVQADINNTGAVALNLGGFAGKMSGDLAQTEDSYTANNSLQADLTSGPSSLGQWVGWSTRNDANYFVDCYVNRTLNGVDGTWNEIGSVNGGAGDNISEIDRLTDAQFHDHTNFPGLTFNATTWDIDDDGQGDDSFPFLSWQTTNIYLEA